MTQTRQEAVIVKRDSSVALSKLMRPMLTPCCGKKYQLWAPDLIDVCCHTK